MLVIMTGGIDLSVPGTFLLGGLLMVGVGQQSDDRIWVAYLTAIGVAALIGLVNGILIGGLKLNALIVTLAVGQVVTGIVNRYYTTVAIQKPVPEGLSEWTTTPFLGITRIFWIGVAMTLVLMIVFRYTGVGRRFQVVGANPVASYVIGLRVNLNQVAAYVVAAVLYATAGSPLGRPRFALRASPWAPPTCWGRSPRWSSAAHRSPVGWPARYPPGPPPSSSPASPR